MLRCGHFRERYAAPLLFLFSCLAYLYCSGGLTCQQAGLSAAALALAGAGLICTVPLALHKGAAAATTAAALYLLLQKFAPSGGIAKTGLASVALSVPFLYGTYLWAVSCCRRERTLNALCESKLFFRLCMAACCGGILLQGLFCFSGDIWHDEAFSLILIDYPWGEMIQRAVPDVHPPLYYLMLKGFADGLHAFFPNVPGVCLCKLFSVLPFVLMAAAAATVVRRQWGNYVAGLSALALTGAPNLLPLGVEIRMYGWGLFFVTAAYVTAHQVMLRGSLRAWALFALFGLAAAYTHYYACIAVAPAYLFLLYAAAKAGRRQVLLWLAAAISAVLGYLPWLFVFLAQAGSVNEEYWIAPPAIKDYRDYIAFAIQGALNGGFAVLVLLHLLKSLYRRQETRPYTAYMLTGILCSAATLIIGLAATYLIRPVFITRYMLPGQACLWLALILGTAAVGKAHLKLTATLLLAGTCFCNWVTFARTEYRNTTEHQKLTAVLARYPQSRIITTARTLQCTMTALTGKPCLLTYDDRAGVRLISAYGAERLPWQQEAESLLRAPNHPAYLIMIPQTKHQTIPLRLPESCRIGTFREWETFDLYSVPAAAGN